MLKKELRKLYKQKRKELNEEELIFLQKNIYNQIFKFDFSSYNNIHIFLSIKKQKEIDTYPIINFLKKLNKNIIISKSDFKTNTLTHYIYDNNTQIEISKYGIPEPKNGTIFNVKNIDLVFVPLLISDKKNYRVGYGKGFYDRFIAECKPSVKTIGLNFFSPINKITDINEFDIPISEIIYPDIKLKKSL